ncbi:NADH-quinone oxidoreductase subunit J [Candidatus Anaplasma sp. TIGMIC]|uniref:NADH-quinone oxidoreductase subunit J n=1 Tax=Candidatus Anaplasma sp. TIGMIC TaxID=3020713 RepID=UPI002330638A|nr:NADH-quinone oxidoreductase subunit J [Candidatus Anaplasma sp. TIGMIC]MDB1135154.1 NADH-quinone oxidoreductase subunit J [Candidatus Anaplasma sp. TIGMIC]
MGSYVIITAVVDFGHMVGFLFFCFAGMVTISAVAVVLSSNPVYAVLNLILTFFVSSALFILLGAELVAMLLVIVYVGAVAVLFLFVVMMLDLDCVKSSHGLVRYYPVGVLLSAVFFGCATYSILHTKASFVKEAGGHVVRSAGNVFLIGSQMYTECFYVFQMSGILLLVAAVGTLVLTLKFGISKSRKQDVGVQLDRSSKIRLLSPEVGKGVEDGSGAD